MVAMSAGVIGCKTGDDHIGLKASNHPDHIPESFFLPPKIKCFLRGLRIAEVDGSREKLFGSVDPAGRHELLGSKNAEFSSLFRADQILAALAAGERKAARSILTTLREIGQDGGVLVVRMSGHIEDAPEDIQLLKGDLQFRGIGNPPVLRLGLSSEKQRQAKKRINRPFKNIPSFRSQ